MEEQAVLLARLDERTNAMVDTMKRLENKVDTHYITRQEHEAVKSYVLDCAQKSEVEPLKRLVYGSVIGALVALGTAVVSMVSHQIR